MIQPGLSSWFAILAAICFASAWLVPNHYPPWNSFYNEGVMALGLLMLSLASRWTHGLPSAACAALVVAAVPWLQWAFGQLPFSGDAWIASAYLLGFAVAITTGFACARTSAPQLAALLASTALAGGFASSLLAMVQCLQLGAGNIWVVGIVTGGRAVANLAQPNNLGTAITLAVLGLWFLFEQGRIGRVAAGTALLPLLLGIALTQSRTALLFGPVLWLIQVGARRRRVTWRINSMVLPATITIALLLNLSWLELADRLLLDVDAAGGLVNIGLKTSRLQVWPVLVDAIWQSPWKGYGWLQTGAAQLNVAERHVVGEELFLHAHNLFLDLLIWCGLPLGLLLSGLLVCWFISRVRTAASREAVFGTMAVAVLGTHAMLELPHHYAYFLIPVGLWIGLIEAERDSPSPLSRRFAALFACASAVIAVAIAWQYPAVEEDFRRVRFESLSIAVPTTQPVVDAPMLSSLTSYLDAARIPIRAQMSEDELMRMGNLVKRYPYPNIIARYAKALALNDRLAEALPLFEKLRHIYGQPVYQKIRKSLHQQLIAGEVGLAALETELPD